MTIPTIIRALGAACLLIGFHAGEIHAQNLVTNGDFDENAASFSGGNDILIFAIPEPSKAILLALGLLSLLARRRR